MASDKGAGECECKVGRVVEQFAIPEVASELEVRRDDDASLRDLRDVFNRRLVQRALDDHGVDVLADPNAIYDALYRDEATAGRRREIRRRLEDDGVPVDELTDAFVSHVTIRNHLAECLDRSTSRTKPPTPDETLALVEWARSRDEKLITNAVARLARTDALRVGNIDVNHAVRITCQTCGGHYRVDELIDAGGCDCESVT